MAQRDDRAGHQRLFQRSEVLHEQTDQRDGHVAPATPARPSAQVYNDKGTVDLGFDVIGYFS